MDNSPVNTSSGGELYEVEKIIKHKKMTNGKMIYFVKWKVCRKKQQFYSLFVHNRIKKNPAHFVTLFKWSIY